jgi:hypothetical protein
MLHENRKRFTAEMRGLFSETQVQPFFSIIVRSESAPIPSVSERVSCGLP